MTTLPLRSRLPSTLPQVVLYTTVTAWSGLKMSVRDRLERAVREYRERIEAWVKPYEATAEWVSTTRRHTLAWTWTGNTVWLGPIARDGELAEELVMIAPAQFFTALDPLTGATTIPTRPRVVLALPLALYQALNLAGRQYLQAPVPHLDAAWTEDGTWMRTAPMERRGRLHVALLRAIRMAGLWPLLHQLDAGVPMPGTEAGEERAA